MIISNFQAEHGMAILATQGVVRDRVAWSHSVNGHYDVKTGYRVWLKQQGNISDMPHRVRVLVGISCGEWISLLFVAFLSK